MIAFHVRLLANNGVPGKQIRFERHSAWTIPAQSMGQTPCLGIVDDPRIGYDGLGISDVTDQSSNYFSRLSWFCFFLLCNAGKRNDGEKQYGCKESIQHGLAKFRLPELKAVFIAEFLRQYSYVEEATGIHRAARVTPRCGNRT